MRVHWMIKAACAEPYRILFPLGLFGTALGLGVWIPHALWPASFGYPGASHAVLQIQGFLLCFVFGFLGTMLPKVMGVAPLGLFQFLALPAGLLALMAFALAGSAVAAQAVHLLLLLHFIAFLVMRWPHRRGNPPAFFVFIASALLADIAGTVLRLAVFAGLADGRAFRLGALLQFQAFPLLLVLGVGGFLLPKLFANEHIDPQRLKPSGAGLPALLIAAALFLAGCVIEAYLPDAVPALRLGSGTRAAVWFWFLFAGLRLQRVPANLPAYLSAARWSLWAMGAGLALPVVLPHYLLAWEHVVFITGILWLTLSVAARVLTAHGGHLCLLETFRSSVRGFGALVVLAALTRVSTEIWPGGRMLHLALAAGFALAGVALWTFRFGRLFHRFPGDA